MKSLACAAVLLPLLSGCASVGSEQPATFVGFESTYKRVLARAQDGDADSQNAVGYMLYFGDGVEADRVQAHLWFERAARQGNDRARRNLAVMSAGLGKATPTTIAPGPAFLKSDPDRRVGQYYVRFCGGCHGVRGIAAYENSPSFAFGERLDKSDGQLLRSLLEGRQEMPGWEGKLPTSDLRRILAYVRTLPQRFEAGIAADATPASDYLYYFGPMEARRQAGRR